MMKDNGIPYYTNEDLSDQVLHNIIGDVSEKVMSMETKSFDDPAVSSFSHSSSTGDELDADETYSQLPKSLNELETDIVAAAGRPIWDKQFSALGKVPTADMLSKPSFGKDIRTCEFWKSSLLPSGAGALAAGSVGTISADIKTRAVLNGRYEDTKKAWHEKFG